MDKKEFYAGGIRGQVNMSNPGCIKDAINYTDSILQIRRTGRTTKLAEFFIQQLIAMGECFPVDHYPTITAVHDLMATIITTIEERYPLLKGCMVIHEQKLSIYLNKDTYLKNVEKHLSTIIP